MTARLFTMVWGRHLDLFERACVASLAQPGNLAALRQHVAVWDIVTRQQDAARVSEIAARLGGLPAMLHFPEIASAPGEILQREVIAEMRRCIADEAPLLMAPPDSIFGEHSMASICAVGEPPDICVAVPHVRTLPGVLGEPGHAASNAALVAASWKHLHRTWIEAEATRSETNSYAGGVSWKAIGNGMYAVTHRLPTVYLAKFNGSDLGWWEAQMLVGAWDHAWPSKLVAEGRHRIIGSSDAAFIAEVTPEFANIPPCTPANLDEPDKFWGQAAHMVLARNTTAIFRAQT